MGFEFQEGKSYLMPAHFREIDDKEGIVDNVVKDFLPGENGTMVGAMIPIDADAVSAYLPPGFSVVEPATLIIGYLRGPAANHCGGRTINTVTVDVTARFDGEEDHKEGRFNLVIFENEPYWPALGRERVGAPKMLADISEVWSKDSSYGFTVSERGNTILEVEFSNLERIPENILEAQLEEAAGDAWMTWKYIPSVTPGEFDANYPVLMDVTYIGVTEAHAGDAKIRFHGLNETQSPQFHQVSAKLAELTPNVEGVAIYSRLETARMDVSKMRKLK